MLINIIWMCTNKANFIGQISIKFHTLYCTYLSQSVNTILDMKIFWMCGDTLSKGSSQNSFYIKTLLIMLPLRKNIMNIHSAFNTEIYRNKSKADILVCFLCFPNNSLPWSYDQYWIKMFHYHEMFHRYSYLEPTFGMCIYITWIQQYTGKTAGLCTPAWAETSEVEGQSHSQAELWLWGRK